MSIASAINNQSARIDALTEQVIILTELVHALRQEVRELRDERQPGLFDVDRKDL